MPHKMTFAGFCVIEGFSVSHIPVSKAWLPCHRCSPQSVLLRDPCPSAVQTLLMSDVALKAQLKAHEAEALAALDQHNAKRRQRMEQIVEAQSAADLKASACPA